MKTGAPSQSDVARPVLSSAERQGNRMDTRRTDLREAIERLYELSMLDQTGSSEFEQLDHFIQQRLLDTYTDSADPALRAVA